LNNNIPIWLSDWTMQCPKTKSSRVIDDVVVKGETVEEIINNPVFIKKVRKRLGTHKKFLTWIPKNVTLKSQHGFGIKEY